MPAELGLDRLEISPSFSAKATFSNSGTSWPFWMGPRLPPCCAEPVSVEFSFASSAKFSGVTSARMRSASAFVATRMWLAVRPAGTLNCEALSS